MKQQFFYQKADKGKAKKPRKTKTKQSQKNQINSDIMEHRHPRNHSFIHAFFFPLGLLVHNPVAILRSSHQRCSVKKGVLGKFAKFTGKHLCQSLFFNNVAGLQLY